MEIYRGRSVQLQPSVTPDQNVQSSVGQQGNIPGQSPSGAPSNAMSASQMATQLGMSSGPGNMFPVVANSGYDGVPTADDRVSYSNRFGGEFQQPPAYQNPQNWGDRQIEQTSGTTSNSGAAIEGATSINPPSPANNWSSPINGKLNWQGD